MAALEPGRMRDIVRVLTLGVFYIITSASLIHYNKFLLDRSRFGHPSALVLLHTVVCSSFSAVLLIVKPSLFPSLTDPKSQVTLDKSLLFKGALPISICFAGQLVLSNSAYMHSSVAFLQMIKEANIVLVYTFSLALALEQFTWRNAGLLTCILIATCLTIHGELHFSKIGFTLQCSSQLFESTKIVLQGQLLSQAGRKLDALSYVIIVMPLCFVVLCATTGILHIVNPSLNLLPSLALATQWAPHLLCNACLAFLLNVIIALLVKHSSGVAFVLAGIVKDAGIVLAGSLVLHEIVSHTQVIGFSLQLLFITMLSLTKTFPEQFERGFFSGIFGIFFGPDKTTYEAAKPEAFTSLFKSSRPEENGLRKLAHSLEAGYGSGSGSSTGGGAVAKGGKKEAKP